MARKTMWPARDGRWLSYTFRETEDDVRLSARSRRSTPGHADIAAAARHRARARGVRGVGSGTRPAVHAKDISVESGAAAAVNAASRSRARVDGTPDPRFRPRGLSLDAPGRVPGRGNSSRGGGERVTRRRGGIVLASGTRYRSHRHHRALWNIRPNQFSRRCGLCWPVEARPSRSRRADFGMWPGRCTFSIATRVIRRASYVRILTETGVF